METPQTSRTGNRRGFSLLEMLVAVTIASLVMTIACAVFWTVISTSRRLEENSDRAQNLRRLSEALDRDLRNARPPASDRAGGDAVWERETLRFATVDAGGRAGVASYERKGRAIVRIWTPAAKDGKPVEGEVADGIADWGLAYEAEGSLAKEFPPQGWPQAVVVDVRFAEAQGKPGPRLQKRVRLEAEPGKTKER